jgi:hypothetical protein
MRRAVSHILPSRRKTVQTDLKRAERATLFASALGRTTSACTADVRIGQPFSDISPPTPPLGRDRPFGGELRQMFRLLP